MMKEKWDVRFEGNWIESDFSDFYVVLCEGFLVLEGKNPTRTPKNSQK